MCAIGPDCHQIQNLTTVQDFYFDHFQRRSWDNKGSKKGLENIAQALDVIGHEYTHPVIQKTSALKYEGQSGALNEHLADVFGSIINTIYKQPSNPYLFGSSVLNGEDALKAKAIRDMMDRAKGLSPQPAHMDDLKKEEFKKYANDCKPTSDNDQCGVPYAKWDT